MITLSFLVGQDNLAPSSTSHPGSRVHAALAPYGPSPCTTWPGRAGVSLITASRALSNPDKVSAATIARVQQAVEATGYIPNLLAGGLKSKRSDGGRRAGAGDLGAAVPADGAAADRGAGPQRLPADPRADRLRPRARRGAARHHDRPPRRRHRRRRPAARRRGHRTAAAPRHPGGRDLGPERPPGRHGGRLLAPEGRQRGRRLLPRQGLASVSASPPPTTSAPRMRREGFVSAVGRDVPTAIVPAPSNLRSAGARWASCCAGPEAAGGLLQLRRSGRRAS